MARSADKVFEEFNLVMKESDMELKGSCGCLEAMRRRKVIRLF